MPLVINMEVTDAEQQDQWFEQAHWMLGVIYDKNQKTRAPGDQSAPMTGASAAQTIHHSRSAISTHSKKPNHPVSPIPSLFQYDEEKSFLKQFAEYDNLKDSANKQREVYSVPTNTSTTSQSSKFSFKFNNLSDKIEKNLFNLKSKWSSGSSSSSSSSSSSRKKNRDSSSTTWCNPANFDADLCHSLSRSNSLLLDEELMIDEGSSKASSPTNSYISTKGSSTLQNVYSLENN